MPVSDPAQTSFAGGELSKRLRGRFDSDLYKRSLDLVENFAVLPQGGLRSRWGSGYSRTLAANPLVRLRDFRVPGQQDFTVELGDSFLRLYDSGALVDFIGSNFVRNGNFTEYTGLKESTPGSGIFGLYCDAYWTVSRGTFGTAAIFPVKDASGSFANLQIIAGAVRQAVYLPAGPVTIAFSYAGSLDLIRCRLGSTPGGEEVYAADFAHTADGFTFANVTSGVVNVPATGTYYLEFDQTTNNPGTIYSLKLITIAITVSTLQLPTPWTAAMVGDVQTVGETGQQRLMLFHPNAAPMSLQLLNGVTWAFGPITFSGQPKEWGGTNWPGVAELHQGRLWLAGTPNERNSFWASKSGNLFDFTTGDQAGDALSYKLATKGAIRWMRGQRMLLVGTDIGEHSVTANGQVVTVSDIDVHAVSAFGSADGDSAVNIGSMVLYLSPDRRKVRAIAFENESQNWESKDVTFVAEHITEGGVKEIHYARDPDQNIVVVMKDGTVRCCTFDRAEQVQAWWRVTTDGQVLSAAVSDGPAGSIAWLAVQRTGGVFLEKLAMREVGQPVLDAYVTLAGPLLEGVPVAGLAHLEGKAVKIIIDGAIEEDQVVAGGAITPARDGAAAIVGLGYTQTAVTLPLEAGGARGTAQGTKRRRVKTVLLLNDSALPLVNGERAADRTPSTAMDTPEARMTGECEARGLGYDDRGQVTIEQDLPLRTEVLALYGVTSGSEV